MLSFNDSTVKQKLWKGDRLMAFTLSAPRGILGVVSVRGHNNRDMGLTPLRLDIIAIGEEGNRKRTYEIPLP